ncbi:hypothetical protein B0H15DRAFT_956355 [Mycena belliarum]|uniref:Uncharacterized protein n=1 Tax=Mycena belliarum TaxID=1033014 RepID=A0AAD6TRE6_9AGAR|nr:hypothetical protein B0H15DRAFT_956355 [Mycena belliae]
MCYKHYRNPTPLGLLSPARLADCEPESPSAAYLRRAEWTRERGSALRASSIAQKDGTSAHGRRAKYH